MRRAVGDAAGLTVARQIQEAARSLGYPAAAWRVKEAWYGRAGAWSAAALDDLRQRGVAWREREQARAASDPGCSSPTLAHRVEAIRHGLSDLMQHVDELVDEINRSDR